MREDFCIEWSSINKVKREEDAYAFVALERPLFYSNPFKLLVTATIKSATLASAIQIAAARTGSRSRRSSTPATNGSADARAQGRAAGDSPYRACASFEIASRRAPVKSIEARAARADGRALLTADERAYASASGDDRRRARLAPEARASASILRRDKRRNRRGENHKA
jgi:hypothetical protein